VFFFFFFQSWGSFYNRGKTMKLKLVFRMEQGNSSERAKEKEKREAKWTRKRKKRKGSRPRIQLRPHSKTNPDDPASAVCDCLDIAHHIPVPITCWPLFSQVHHPSSSPSSSRRLRFCDCGCWCWSLLVCLFFFANFPFFCLLGFQSSWSLCYDLCCNRVQLSLSFLCDVSALLILLLCD